LQEPTKDVKSGKAKQNNKEELKKLKINIKTQNQHPLKSTLPNSLNASSPP
jgi:hypothetical protein